MTRRSSVELPSPRALPVAVVVPSEPVNLLHYSTIVNGNDDEDNSGVNSVDGDANQESAPFSKPTVEELDTSRTIFECERKMPETPSSIPNADPNTVQFDQHYHQQSPNIEFLDTLRISSLPVSQEANAKLIRRLTGRPTVSWPFDGSFD